VKEQARLLQHLITQSYSQKHTESRVHDLLSAQNLNISCRCCLSVRLIGHATIEHLAQLHLRENPSTLSDSVIPIPQLGQGFECLVTRA
jgi:hypothetical protein